MKAACAMLALVFSLLAAGFTMAGEKLPSEQLKPLLEPSLEGLIAPLQRSPKMPRVEIELLRAKFAAQVAKATSPAWKEVYQNAVVVCDSLTRGMDDRAAKKASKDSTWQETSIVSKRNIMNHFTHQIQLEGAASATSPGTEGVGSQAAPSRSHSVIGTWKRYDGTYIYEVKEDHSATTKKPGSSNVSRNGTWSLDSDGLFTVKWEDGRSGTDWKLSDDGDTLVGSGKGSYNWIRAGASKNKPRENQGEAKPRSATADAIFQIDVISPTHAYLYVDNYWQTHAECLECKVSAAESVDAKGVAMKAYFYDDTNKLIEKVTRPSSQAAHGGGEIPPVSKFELGKKYSIFFGVPTKARGPSNKWKRVVIVVGPKWAETAKVYPKDDIDNFDFPEKKTISAN
jgi:hypothetical protein